jgi:hypothetical protein
VQQITKWQTSSLYSFGANRNNAATNLALKR